LQLSKVANGKLIIKEFQTNDEEIVDFFKEVNPEEFDSKLNSSLKVGVTALKTVATTERIDYIEKEFQKLDTKFNDVLKQTMDKISENIDSTFGENGQVPAIIEKKFGENGTVDSIIDNYLGEKGTLTEIIEKQFGKDGTIIKEILDPTKPGTPLNQLRQFFTEELARLTNAIGIEQAKAELKDKSTQKGKDFEDVLEELLGPIVKAHMGDMLIRTGAEIGELTDSKKGDFVININGSAQLRIVIEAKDMKTIATTTINSEIEEGLKNRSAQFGILVIKWIEALPRSVGCFNCYEDNKIVCGLGSKADEVLHEEILQAAYCWGRTYLLKKSGTAANVDFALIDTQLNEIKKQLGIFDRIQRQCENIEDATTAIREFCDAAKPEIQAKLNNIWRELEKQQQVPAQ
jgi:hypothetical protein